MAVSLDTLDWSLIRSFLAVADEGSLSGAARRLGQSQPTLGRQIRTLETALGATLFLRRARGFELTAEAVALIGPARAMQEAAARLALAAGSSGPGVSGTVRITASVAVSIWHLPRIVSSLLSEEPGLEIEIVPTDRSTNLLYREADIAVRMYRPVQLDLVTRHVGDLSLGAYAARSYMARRGKPRTLADLEGHDFVGLDRETLLLDGFHAAGVQARKDWFRARCDDTAVGWALVRAGCGIGFSQKSVGGSDPEVEEIDFGFPLPRLPVWLTAHEAMRRDARIRRVWEALADGLAPLVD